MGGFRSYSALLVVWLICGYVEQVKAANASTFGQILIENDDPITLFKIDFPEDGGASTLPLRFKFAIETSSIDAFKERYGEMFICVELEHVITKCSSILNSKIRFHELVGGSYVARAYIWNAQTEERHRETESISLSIVTTAEFNIHAGQLIERYRMSQDFPQDINILQWAEQHKREENSDTMSGYDNSEAQSRVANNASSNDTVLTIGVKTAVLDNFALRQAIRETWASKTSLSAHIKVYFVGCTPNMDDISNSEDRQRLQAAISLEKEVYGDLLTEELQCQDSHLFLAEKVASFLEWVVAELPWTQFVMIADDDIYLRVDNVVEDLTTAMPHERLYLGELSNNLHPQPLGPVRIETDPYFTSELSYPMNQFVPYAAGPHFVLSADCVRFLARNRRRLASLHGQDDTSIALWLLAIQVHVRRTSAFIILRFTSCKDNVLSVADLSSLGIRSIHANLLHNRSLCHGFDRLVWEWKPRWSF